ncbi:hypothetical protein BCR33DRAFT_503310 [Rhizoclosmatium globosum]|uniref:Uncharacterized protein n=1 Tax=Rhizoclosmatium globosum TaxID=329046 RepID=A0A1Y2CVM8_9FUNG|nr:hypothetical protein BCR33DRAFT_503310 [Rhizoclosmatium globosum]|eukprot:ORY51119.1 hypothetical protein BCR33DRAFT_503310 [Rhizoclosmatium globosum]
MAATSPWNFAPSQSRSLNNSERFARVSRSSHNQFQRFKGQTRKPVRNSNDLFADPSKELCFNSHRNNHIHPNNALQQSTAHSICFHKRKRTFSFFLNKLYKTIHSKIKDFARWNNDYCFSRGVLWPGNHESPIGCAIVFSGGGGGAVKSPGERSTESVKSIESVYGDCSKCVE